MNIHKEGKIYVILSLLIYAVLMLLWYFLGLPGISWACIFFGVIFFLVLNFFRNPDRAISQPDKFNVFAPADGKIVVIEKVFEPEFLQKECIQVSIFMNPLNVHVNRYPVGGKVSYSRYHPGKYLVAWDPKSSTENERTTVGIDSDAGPVILMRQIAGALARRIVCYSKEGDIAVQGQDMGFIKFGSRVDLFLPLDAQIQVALDQKVKGNLDAIARLK